MINNTHRRLRWKVVSESLFGFPERSLACVAYNSGGGFAGSPEEIELAPIGTIILPNGDRGSLDNLEVAEFPQPSESIEYHIGGRTFRQYHYKRE